MYNHIKAFSSDFRNTNLKKINNHLFISGRVSVTRSIQTIPCFDPYLEIAKPLITGDESTINS